LAISHLRFAFHFAHRDGVLAFQAAISAKGNSMTTNETHVDEATVRQSKIDRDAVLRLFTELRDHISEWLRGQHDMDDTLYSFVLLLLFGYSLNNYKAIVNLLPDGFYEQGFARYLM
jgi:hypothetical protein